MFFNCFQSISSGANILPEFEVTVKITVSARTNTDAERLVDSRLIRLESDVIVKTERVETIQIS